MQYLDLDNIAPQITKKVKLKGIEHEMHIPTIADFARDIQETTSLQKRFGKLSEIDLENIEDQATIDLIVETMTRSVRKAFPTIPETDILSMNNLQLAKLREFIEAEVEQAKVEDEAGNV